jgi:hypothetical protein
MSGRIGEVLDRIEAQQAQATAFDGNAHELLVATYQGRYRPTPMQLRAAIESLPFERPKLGVVAIGRMNGEDFASLLERAIERSGKAQRLSRSRRVPTRSNHFPGGV